MRKYYVFVLYDQGISLEGSYIDKQTALDVSHEKLILKKVRGTLVCEAPNRDTAWMKAMATRVYGKEGTGIW